MPHRPVDRSPLPIAQVRKTHFPVSRLVLFEQVAAHQKRDAAPAEWRQLAALNRRRQKNFKTSLY